MPKICYTAKNFSKKRAAVVAKVNQIIEEYAQLGYVLTLRQLYYQFVQQGLISNKENEYKKLGDTLNEARLAGQVDWNAIVDRTRALRSPPHWTDPENIIEAASESFRIDKWADQKSRVEVWVEKDALRDVVERVSQEHDVAFFSCRGYSSQSAVWEGAMRLRTYYKDGQRPIVIYLGDHDPSGKDMTRDIDDRLALFIGPIVDVRRIALNIDQVEQHDLPPNPTKVTDSRAAKYIDEFGNDCWELDALKPTVIHDLIEDEILSIRDDKKWQAKVKVEAGHRRNLQRIATNWKAIEKYVEQNF